MWRPWKVGLRKALQKPWETLSEYIKDTVCSSSLLLFLPHSSLASLASPLFIRLLRLFSFSSTRLLSVSSFTLLFGHVLLASPFFRVTQPTFSCAAVLTPKAESSIKRWRTGERRGA